MLMVAPSGAACLHSHQKNYHVDAKQLFENLTSLRQEAIAAAKIEDQSMIDMINGCNKALTAHFPESFSGKFR